MSIFSILETIFIGPLKLIFEFIFHYAYTFLNDPALAIIVLSLMMNILVLPLYKRADAMQEEARDIENKLHKGVAHIKKSFSSDEKMMILQTYYRQNNYKPTDALKGSVSLLLEIPFFMAAYQFLSHLAVLDGASLGPISDLGKPDGLIVIGGLAINLLPILMTLINVISSALYLKGFPLKTKIQLYGMAAFFLVFLYTSPSGLVFYWTLNNLFSLVKTIFYKLKNPKKVISVILSVVGLAVFAFGVYIFGIIDLKKKIFIFAMGLLLELPLLLPIIKSKINFKEKSKAPAPDKKLFLAGSVFLTVLVGLLIPSALVASSPQEFVDVTYFHNPLWYIASTFCMAAGTFLVWLRVFYWLATPKGKVIFDKLIWVMSGVMIVNYMFFGTNLGIISSTLQYEKSIIFTNSEQLINLAVLFAVATVFFFIVSKWSKVVTGVLLSAIIALGGMSVVNMVKINSSVNSIKVNDTAYTPHFNLSTNGHNVVVIMLDRAMGEYVPYLLNEKPELKEQFDGFTYYSNTISYGAHTNFGVPAVMGGYEYTPVELNKRDTEPLVDKHNEALKLMPTLFNNNNYEVTLCDVPYANYKWIPDLSIFDDMPEVNTYITKGNFSDDAQKAQTIEQNYRNFFCFSVMKSMPVFAQPTLYNSGHYRRMATANNSNDTDESAETTQTMESTTKASGYNQEFLDSYNVLKSLDNITTISDSDKNTFLFLYNDMTHTPTMLQAPDFTPQSFVDNTEYDKQYPDRFNLNDNKINISEPKHMALYHTNMSALLRVGEWLDYLREQNVYDNTRIIIVADHGYGLYYHNEELDFSNKEDYYKNVEFYYPMLMVKDFNATGFNTSDEFMTNADVPILATKDLIENPVNPFTGKAINNNEKSAHEQLVITSDDWDVNKNNGTTYLPSGWASVSKNLRDRNNWKFYDREVVLQEHKLPQD